MFGPTARGEGNPDEMKIIDLQEQVGRGKYKVDPHAVADAIVRRLLAERGQRAAAQGHDSA
jgi:anti-sigma28 factor (negative regulator of flagellin synthesis)